MGESTEEADKILFGAMNADMADHLAVCIDKALDQGVSTLPCLDDEKQQTMKGLLSKKFMKNVDVVESYCQRNIFTLRQQTPKRVADVLALFQNLPEGNVPELVEPTMDEVEEDSSSQLCEMPSLADIPTMDQLVDLEHELVRLRQQYTQLILKRAALERDNETWSAAQNLANFASETLGQVLRNPQQQIVNPVTIVVEQHPELVDSIHQGQELLEELSETAKRSAGQQDGGVFVLGQYKKPKTTLDERIQMMTSVCSDENKANALLALISDPAAKETGATLTTPFRASRPQHGSMQT